MNINFGDGIEIQIGTTKFIWNGKRTTLDTMHDLIKRQHELTKAPVKVVFAGGINIYYKGTQTSLEFLDSKLKGFYQAYKQEKDPAFTVEEFKKYFDPGILK